MQSDEKNWMLKQPINTIGLFFPVKTSAVGKP